MRRGLLFLLAPLLLSGAVVAQTQGGVMRGDQVLRGDQVFRGDPVVRGDQIVVSPTKQEAVVARISPNDVVSRLLTFDRDHDGKLAQSELAERMQPLMARADKNRDGVLDAKEIRAIASATRQSPQPEQGQEGRPFGSSYGFADEDISFSSRNHIEGAIEDLKLAAGTNEQALSIAKNFVDRIEGEAEADLVKDLTGVLQPEQILALRESLTNRQKAISINRRFVASASVSMQPHINQFRLTPDKRLIAQKAVNRYTARVKMSDAVRLVLVNQMSGVLNAEERDNLRASLARRPLVAKDGDAGVVKVQANLIDIATAVDKIKTPTNSNPAFGPPTSVRAPLGR